MALVSGGVTVALVVAVGILLVLLNKWHDFVLGMKMIPGLRREVAGDDGSGDGAAPRVSLIVPACNEERALESAVLSMLRQDYPNLEVVLINDRSTDGTGEVMEHLAARFSAIRVIHIETLPAGWLGKNHALYQGSLAATGEWLLFADADVVMDPTAIRRAVAYAERHSLDHLTMSGKLVATNYWLRGWIAFAIMSFTAYQSIHKVNDPRSRVGAGFGMFNLVRRTAYEHIGTHEAISLRPDDDMRLGQRIKQMGLRQQIVNGKGLLQVEWYPTLGQALRGFDKNLFAFLGYSPWVAAGSVLAVLTVMVWPFAAVILLSGLARWLYAAAILLQLAMFAIGAWISTGSLAVVPFYPLNAVIFALNVIRVVLRNYREGGIWWRGTFYPLALLRSQSGLPGEGRGRRISSLWRGSLRER